MGTSKIRKDTKRRFVYIIFLADFNLQKQEGKKSNSIQLDNIIQKKEINDE